MKKRYFGGFSAIALSLLLIPAVSLALRMAVGETGVVPGASGIGGATIISPDDHDTSDDDIVQFNNLVIASISNTGLPALITASSDVGQRCLTYDKPTSSIGIAFPCPVMPSHLYQIRVEANSILLLRTRARASLQDLAVGDRINVYGFMDRDTNAIEALIIRNLDKPTQTRFVQLNNLEVVSAPDASAPPASFIAMQRFVTPCYDFGVTGTGTKAAISCPIGTERFESSRSNETPSLPPTTPSGSSPSSFYDYPPLRKYRVLINTATRILDHNRILIPLTGIGIRDRVNIYGTVDANGNVNAVIVRNLSKPADLRVSIDTIDPSSGAVGTVVTLTGTGFVAGPWATRQSYPPQSESPQYMIGANTVMFGSHKIPNVTSPNGTTLQFSIPSGIGCEDANYPYACDPYPLAPGTYRISVKNANGESNSISFIVTPTNPTPSIHVLSPNGGETWAKGTTGTIQWQDNTPYPICPPGAQCAPADPKYYEIVLVPYRQPCTGETACPAGYPVLAPYTIAKYVSGTSYQWPVGKIVNASGTDDLPPDGAYTIRVCQSGTTTCDSSDNYFNITSEGVVQLGWLSIQSSNTSLDVGETIHMQALYQPPMPSCPEGMACTQVMPAPRPVQATWTSSNPRVATVAYKNTCPPGAYCLVGPDRLTAVVTGVGAGTTELKAAYTLPSGIILTATTGITVTGGIAPPPPVVGQLSIQPASLKLRVGERAPLESLIGGCPQTSGMNLGCIQILRQVASRWTSSNLAIAGVHCPLPITAIGSAQSDSCGVAEVIATAPGNVEIKAMSDATPYTGRATVEVIAP